MPQEDENTIYINCGMYGGNAMRLADMLELARARFGQEVEWHNLDITAEHIQTRGLGFDLYDSSDYDNFIVITRK